MSQLAIVFPGQGSQKTGMLAELAQAPGNGIVETSFAEASAAIGSDLWDIAQRNPDGLLDQTEFTQPALLAAGIALWRLWRERGGARPDLLAGHSLGEYTALVAAEVLEFSQAVKVVHQRGQFMQRAVPSGTGGIAAIIGLDSAKLEAVCLEAEAAGEGTVSPANHNSPGQTVIAGDSAAVKRAMALCKQAGAKRALPLKMSVPSHCALMEPARGQLETELAKLEFRPAAIPVVQNATGRASRDPEEIRHNLGAQLCSPVRWIDCVETMHAAGATHFLECGPGKVLAGLIKRIAPSAQTHNSEDPASLAAALAETSASTSTPSPLRATPP
ncbi:MAG: ACP S-malonyltransferase [Gammaproteobacteria bacterium]|nr:ACP S-malonyltransferase [Gammaproteobacteria bacterium]